MDKDLRMIETLVKPQSLDNDVAVIKILQLMGQLSPNDIAYVLKVSAQVYDAIALGGTYSERK
jgi:hypothetical protein